MAYPYETKLPIQIINFTYILCIFIVRANYTYIFMYMKKLKDIQLFELFFY